MPPRWGRGRSYKSVEQQLRLEQLAHRRVQLRHGLVVCVHDECGGAALLDPQLRGHPRDVRQPLQAALQVSAVVHQRGGASTVSRVGRRRPVSPSGSAGSKVVGRLVRTRRRRDGRDVVVASAASAAAAGASSEVLVSLVTWIRVIRPLRIVELPSPLPPIYVARLCRRSNALTTRSRASAVATSIATRGDRRRRRTRSR